MNNEILFECNLDFQLKMLIKPGVYQLWFATYRLSDADRVIETLKTMRQNIGITIFGNPKSTGLRLLKKSIPWIRVAWVSNNHAKWSANNYGDILIGSANLGYRTDFRECMVYFRDRERLIDLLREYSV